MPCPVRRHLPLCLVLLAGCPFPAEPDEPGLPEGTCHDPAVRVSEGRWKLSAPVIGASRSELPGQIAELQMSFALSPELSLRALELRLSLTVQSGQSLPDQQLLLQLGEQVLQTATLAGPHDDEVHFDTILPLETCGSRCLLTVTSATVSVGSEVPVPLALAGTLDVFVPNSRKYVSCSTNDIQVGVTSAN